MAITYTLKITQLDCLPQAEGETDVVFRAHWAYTGSDGTNSAGYGGSTELTFTPGSPFTPYDQLTQEQVVGWVLGAWTAEQKASYEQIIADQLAVITPPLPWPGENVIQPVADTPEAVA